MSIVKEIILMESSYQNVLDEKYFVFQDYEYEYVVSHLMFHPADTGTSFYLKKGTNDIFEFELEVSVGVHVNSLKGVHLASAIIEGEIPCAYQASTGKIAPTGDFYSATVTKYKRLRADAPYSEDSDVTGNGREALNRNKVYLKTAAIRYITGESNWKDFIQEKVAEFRAEQEEEEEL